MKAKPIVGQTVLLENWYKKGVLVPSIVAEVRRKYFSASPDGHVSEFNLSFSIATGEPPESEFGNHWKAFTDKEDYDAQEQAKLDARERESLFRAVESHFRNSSPYFSKLTLADLRQIKVIIDQHNQQEKGKE